MWLIRYNIANKLHIVQSFVFVKVALHGAKEMQEKIIVMNISDIIHPLLHLAVKL